MIDWLHMPSLAALRAFEAAAREGSFTRAAAALNVTHAAIAQHVRGLEAELGRTLVVRDGRGIAATEDGKVLAEALTQGFETIGAGIARLRADDAARPLTISVTPAFATNWLMPRVGDFWARHPEIQINISPAIELTDLRRDGIDVAVRYGRGPWPPYDAKLLTDGEFWIVARPDLLDGLQAECVEDVAGLPWLVDRNLREWKALLSEVRVDIDDLKVTSLNLNGLVLSALKEGLGVSLQARTLVERDVREGSLQRICVLRQEGLGYHVLTDPQRPSARTKTFVRWIMDQVRTDRRDEPAKREKGAWRRP
ncbi:LysR family transcriptional regulator [Jannaschia aquimarina]|uniref:GcvA_3 protein n=1 Tax=Jannaschia aquimarina TaxID=935700 RepID=A0A0D1EIC5_9RHOB|nr:LysR family transcriptional regulator [Jannaschia aquimarina]KIT15600.1 Glycine cleavage system transcriptional activator [Jannaschia aquimarina]SNT27534.1 LysR family transcriptional regulator, glycine cleavage system transcriptional activator [Jannaschia aquimarina]